MFAIALGVDGVVKLDKTCSSSSERGVNVERYSNRRMEIAAIKMAVTSRGNFIYRRRQQSTRRLEQDGENHYERIAKK